MRPLGPCAFAILVAGLLGCNSPRSGAGFRLPAGDAEKGQAAFVELKCHQCHKVEGLDLPAPTVEPPVPVVLGGEVPHIKTDGDLMTSIVNPSHRIILGHRADLIEKDGASRMPDYGQIMTVRQMIDLVAFLQARYKVVRPGEPIR